MAKETVTKFDIEAAFKALDEIELPKAEGGRFKANRVDLHERLNAKNAYDVLVEDYFDVNNVEDLTAAQEEREAEVAKAKLARIEKIVDLDAESEEDILPSYVGKFIMQCPQCMTLFYKDEEDIETSEETPDVVNINEICQHCGNSSGYTLVGKVGNIDETEAENFEQEVSEEEGNELDLDFPEEGTEEVDAEGTGEGAEEMAAEDDFDLDLDLDLDLDEEEEETEEANESLHNSKLLDKIEDENDLKTDIESEHLTLNEDFEEDAEIDTNEKVIEEPIEEAFDSLKRIEWKKMKGKYDLTPIKGSEIKKGDLIIQAPARNIDKLDDDDFAVYAMKVIQDGEDTEIVWGGGNGTDYLSPDSEDFIKATKKDKNESLDEDIAESVHNSELLQKIEDKNELKTDIESEHSTLNEETELSKSDTENKEPVETFEVYVDKSGSLSSQSYDKVTKAIDDITSKNPDAKVDVYYFDDFSYSEPLAAAKAGKNVVVYTDEDYKTNCPELETFENVSIVDILQEDLGDWYRKKFDKPASINTQQAWEDEMVEIEGELGYGDPSDKRKEKLHKRHDKLAGKFAQQRDWEARHSVETEVEPIAEPEVAPIAETLTEDAVDNLFDTLWSKKQPTEAETQANLKSLGEGAKVETLENFEDAEDFDEESFDEHLTKYMTEVYSNVESFKSTTCTLNKNTLMVEGLIKFKSGREKATKFTFEASAHNLQGTNTDLAESKAFTLDMSLKDRKLVTEHFAYNYKIGESSVEGHI